MRRMCLGGGNYGDLHVGRCWTWCLQHQWELQGALMGSYIRRWPGPRSSCLGSRQLSLVSLWFYFLSLKDSCGEGTRSRHTQQPWQVSPSLERGGLRGIFSELPMFICIFIFFIFPFKRKIQSERNVWLLVLISADKGEKKHKGKSVSPSVIELIKMHIFNV